MQRISFFRIYRIQYLHHPIYFNNNGQVRLLPEFIYGYVPVYDNYVCGEIIRNPNYRDTHEYENDGLIYDTDAEVSSYKMN